MGSCEAETGLNFEPSESILSGGSSGLLRQHFSPRAQRVYVRFKLSLKLPIILLYVYLHRGSSDFESFLCIFECLPDWSVTSTSTKISL